VLKRHCHLEALKEGAFLANGARVYVDQGKQNEYSTPETSSPSELVACELAGRRLMAQCARAAGVSLLCSNVDPETGATWGTHENYECSWSARELASEWLYPHLVTRIIYAGAGGVDPAHPGARLVLSPRASLIRASFSCQGLPLKTLVFAKPESYCEGFRLHVFCGESLLCHSASYLKVATTALVARCLAQGLQVGPGRLGVAPVQALRRVNRDVSLSCALPLADGRRMTALEIQACYL
jgi:proteasome accessory factor A